MEIINIRSEEGKLYEKPLYELYERSFPEAEKKSVSMMKRMEAQGKLEMLALVEKGKFAGLIINMFSKKDVLLDYFAIEESVRGTGLGNRAIQEMLERFRDRKYILEIEALNPKAENFPQRKWRKHFYLKNGVKETDVFAFVYGTDFELLTSDGKLTYEEYVSFLKEVLGPDIVTAGKIYPLEDPAKNN